jgi:hypothetical protein
LVTDNGSGLAETAISVSLKYEFSEKDSKLLLFELGKCSCCGKLVLAAGFL